MQTHIMYKVVAFDEFPSDAKSCRCGQKAIYVTHWGSDALPHQQGVMCEECGKELWGRLSPLLASNKAWYYLEPLPQETHA